MTDDIVQRLRRIGVRRFGKVVEEIAEEQFIPNSTCQEAADEIDRLCRWKDEALEVLAGWETVYGLFDPRPGDLGLSKAVVVRHEIERLRETLRLAFTAIERSTPHHADDVQWVLDTVKPAIKRALEAER